MSEENIESNFLIQEANEEELQFQNNSSLNYDDDDLKNLEEIEREMRKLNNEDEFDNEDENEEDIMAELEDEINRTAELADSPRYGQNQQNSSSKPSGGSYLPAGATPSRNGVLSPHAAEFWFPECRNCPCCKGFKHGCTCRSKGVDTCIDPTCKTATATPSSDSISSNITSTSTVPPAGKPTGSYLPPGAVPSQGGVLSPQAAEFWFPECRDCPCCKGYKHGCTCRSKGVNVCQQCSAGEVHSIASPGSTSNSSYNNSGGSSNNPPSAPSEICKFFASGNCRFGAACRFSHGGAPAAGSGGNTQASPHNGGNPSSQVCTFFLQGRCQFGTSCKYAHTAV